MTPWFRLRFLPLLAATACTDAADGATATRQVVPVELAAAADAGVTDAVVATGRYAARDEIPLAFKTGGVVARLLVDEGDAVRRGQLLAVLDLREIDAIVARAQAGADKAQRDHDRVARLAADSVATRAQLQDAATALDAARADLAQARVNREYSVITAPEAGVVQQRLLVAGALAAPGQPVLLLGGARRGAVVRAGVADRDAVRLRAGDDATARFSALPGREYTGRVVLVGRAADPRTGTYPVEVALTGAATLPLGLVGELRLTPRAVPRSTLRGVRGNGARADASIGDGVRRGVAVPMTALLEPDGDSATVLVMASARDTVPQPRRVGLRGAAGDAALVDGLAAGTLVVARGAAYVTPGTVVRVTAADTAVASAGAPRAGGAP